MAINFLDEVYTQLEQLDLVGSRKEFCEQWLGRAEGYVRTLRFYRCVHKHDHSTDSREHEDVRSTL